MGSRTAEDLDLIVLGLIGVFVVNGRVSCGCGTTR